MCVLLLLLLLITIAIMAEEFCDVTGHRHEISLIFQQLSVTIQQFNAALYRETFVLHDDSDL